MKKGVARLQDETLDLWKDICGDHMHHGFYQHADSAVSDSDHRLAQVRMIEESLRFAGVSGSSASFSFICSFPFLYGLRLIFVRK